MLYLCLMFLAFLSFSCSIISLKKFKRVLQKIRLQIHLNICPIQVKVMFTLISLCSPPLGKVSIKKEDLCKYTGKENWFMLQPIDSNSEVQVTIKSHIYILKN